MLRRQGSGQILDWLKHSFELHKCLSLLKILLLLEEVALVSTSYYWAGPVVLPGRAHSVPLTGGCVAWPSIVAVSLQTVSRTTSAPTLPVRASAAAADWTWHRPAIASCGSSGRVRVRQSPHCDIKGIMLGVLS